MVEKFAKFFIASTVFFAVWGLGGIRNFETSLLIFFSATSLIFAIFAHPEEFKAPKIFVKNPFFLASCILVGMGVIQILNPAFELSYYSDIVLIKDLQYIDWLPSGVACDSESYSTKKYMSYLVVGAFFANTIWAMRHDAKFTRFLLEFFAINAFLMAILAIVQIYTNAPAPYWTFTCKSHFFGAFYYVNAGCAFMNLGLASIIVCAYLSFRQFNTAKGILWCALIPFVVYSFFISSSLGARVSFILLLSFCGILYIFVLLKRKYPKKIKSILFCIGAITLFAGIIFGAFCAQYYQRLGKPKQESVMSRLEHPKIALKIYSQAPILGSGFGSFPIKAARLNSEFQKSNFRAAHNDFLNYASEFGLVGALAILYCFAIWIWNIFKRRSKLSYANAILFISVIICILHSMCDVLLTTPSIMVAFTMLMALTSTPLQKHERY